MIYKTLKKVSDYCQLMDKSKFPATQTINGVTFTNNGDGTITVNGTASKNIYITILSDNLELSTHKKYLLTGCPSGGSSYTYFLYVDRDGALFEFDTGNGSIGTPTKLGAVVTIFVRQGLTLNNLTFKPQLFDLTEMYGSGNEPTTVEEFREKFPNELYDYKPYCFVKSYKTLLKATDDKIITSYKKSLICTTKNLFDKSLVVASYDYANATLIEIKKNGWILQGNPGIVFGSSNHSSGWFNPGNKAYTNSTGIYLKAGDTVTVSAYYTVLENNSTGIANIYLGGTKLKTYNYDNLPDVGVKTRRYKTFTIADGEEGHYYPVFTLNSSKILIEDIQVEYGDTPTEYHPYGYL